MQSSEPPIVVVLDQSNAYQARIVTGIRTQVEPAGIPLLIVARDPFAEQLAPSLQRALDTLAPRGVITNTLDTPEAEQQVRAALAARPWLPTVHVGTHRGGCSIRADNAVGMRALVEHLVADCAVRRPLVVRGIAHQPDSVEREEVLREVFAARGIPLDDGLFVDGHFHRDNAYRSVTRLLQTRRDMDAVIAFNDRSALGALDAVAEAGLRVPHDVVVTGFDDDELSALSTPPLTTVAQDTQEQGALAVRLLLRIVAGEQVGEVRVPTRLVVRDSTARAAGAARTAPGPSVGTRQLWEEVGVLDSTLAITRAFMGCTTVGDLVGELVAALPSLSIQRCFLVLLERGQPPGSDPLLARVALAWAPGTELASWTADAEQTFDAAAILPDHLAHHLRRGTLTQQPLSTEHGEIGSLLIEQRDADRFVSDALRMDLSRSLDSLARTADLADHTQRLEALVAQRTLELQAEVRIRRQAEEDLRLVNDDLRARLHVDGLTGICNRVGFDERLAEEVRLHARSAAPLSLLMVDVDHFKPYNDAYGHLSGDECLRQVARTVRSAVHRPGDLTARYGGEEFAVILPATDRDGALAIAEGIRVAVQQAGLHHGACAVGHVTVSIGAATVVPTARLRPAALIGRADEALYAAKDAGRDTVVAVVGVGVDAGVEAVVGTVVGTGVVTGVGTG